MNDSRPPPLPPGKPPGLTGSSPPPIPQKTKVEPRFFGVPIPEAVHRVISPESKLTRTGVGLTWLTGIATLVAVAVLLFWFLPLALPKGGSYPKILIPMFTLAFGVGFFCVAGWVAEQFGFSVTVVPSPVPLHSPARKRNRLIILGVATVLVVGLNLIVSATLLWMRPEFSGLTDDRLVYRLLTSVVLMPLAGAAFFFMRGKEAALKAFLCASAVLIVVKGVQLPEATRALDSFGDQAKNIATAVLGTRERYSLRLPYLHHWDLKRGEGPYDLSGSFRARLNLGIMVKAPALNNLSDEAENVRRSLHEEGQELSTSDNESVTIDGREWIRFSRRSKFEGNEVVTLCQVYSDTQRTYILYASYYTQSSPSGVADLTSILDSFRFPP
jgi:hypothetical protein